MPQITATSEECFQERRPGCPRLPTARGLHLAGSGQRDHGNHPWPRPRRVPYAACCCRGFGIGGSGPNRRPRALLELLIPPRSPESRVPREGELPTYRVTLSRAPGTGRGPCVFLAGSEDSCWATFTPTGKHVSTYGERN
ncbi:unnamed protein product [Rangifer tarandus platyrhynchus]|uniref:Uncharacterized protein n=2 Tax=Rangifer tarandus platyrhynchus TaxID=3082113 RepID=A0ABN8YT53_RANTA|nr:unnamed protein product [Rangifer tarandus platyrhynchus]CAI9702355.1 unnamed protein product [Rangifer tarandus platyrhynchus]